MNIHYCEDCEQEFTSDSKEFAQCPTCLNTVICNQKRLEINQEPTEYYYMQGMSSDENGSWNLKRSEEL
jgi:hypothetical protein